MKIGLVCPYNITRGGGVQEVVLATKAELTKRGHHVKIITPRPRSSETLDLPDVIFVGSAVDYKSPMATSTQLSAGDIEKIDAVLAEENFDILHLHEPWQPLLSLQILQRSNSVNVATFHAQLPETMMSRSFIKAVTPYLRSVMKYLHVLTAVSNAGAEYANSMTSQVIEIIPNGIDLQKYKQVSRDKALDSKKTKTILFVGRLEKRKGVKYLLRAYQLLSQANPDVQLIIAGDGPDREMLELLADDLQLKNVSFLGYISEELKLELLAEADIFCSPAIYGESFGIVLLEAMATGTVVVAGNNVGYKGLMQDTGALSIVDVQSSDEFARRLDLMLHNQAFREQWQQWAKKYVKQFNWSIVANQYEDMYKRALKEHGR